MTGNTTYMKPMNYNPQIAAAKTDYIRRMIPEQNPSQDQI